MATCHAALRLSDASTPGLTSGAGAGFSEYDVRLITRMSGRCHLDLDLARPLQRIRVRRGVAEHVVVAGLVVDPLERLVEVVLIDDRDAAGFVGQHAQAVLRLAHVLAVFDRVELFVEIRTGDQAARVDRVDRRVGAVRGARQLAELAREVGVGERLAAIELIALLAAFFARLAEAAAKDRILAKPRLRRRDRSRSRCSPRRPPCGGW